MDLLGKGWDILDSVHDGRFVLRLLAFILMLDVVLVSFSGTNLANADWNDLTAEPRVLIATALSYGALVTLLGPVTWGIIFDVLFILPLVGSVMSVGRDAVRPNPQYFVTASTAQRWAAKNADASRLAKVEEQIAEREKDRRRWHSTVGAGWVSILLIGGSYWVPTSVVGELWQTHVELVCVFLFVAGVPCLYDLLRGTPGHEYIELPEAVNGAVGDLSQWVPAYRGMWKKAVEVQESKR